MTDYILCGSRVRRSTAANVRLSKLKTCATEDTYQSRCRHPTQVCKEKYPGPLTRMYLHAKCPVREQEPGTFETGTSIVFRNCRRPGIENVSCSNNPMSSPSRRGGNPRTTAFKSLELLTTRDP